MLYLVAYDIPQEHNPLRQRVAEKLMDYGLQRIQKSVFMGRISRNRAEMLALELREMLKRVSCHLHVIPVCTRCSRGIIAVAGSQLEEEEVLVV